MYVEGHNCLTPLYFKHLFRNKKLSWTWEHRLYLEAEAGGLQVQWLSGFQSEAYQGN